MTPPCNLRDKGGAHSCSRYIAQDAPPAPRREHRPPPRPFSRGAPCALFNLRPVPYKKGRKEYMT